MHPLSRDRAEPRGRKGNDVNHRHVPAGTVEQRHCVYDLCCVARDFIDVKLHHIGVGVRKRPRRAFSLFGEDRAEGIGDFVALVSGLVHAFYVALIDARDHFFARRGLQAYVSGVVNPIVATSTGKWWL